MNKSFLWARSGIFCCLCLLLVGALFACSDPSQRMIELKRFPMDSLDGIITRSGAELDTDNSSDGNGSLRIIAKGPETVRLFELGDIEVENAKLTYQAKLRAKRLAGRAYLELRCHFPDGEELITTNAQAAASGTTDWLTAQTSCSLGKGRRPDVIKLDLVIDGKGTVWIDDVRLMKGPLGRKR